MVPVPAVEHRLSFSAGFVFRLDRFQDAKFNVTVETCFYGLKWNRNRVVVCAGTACGSTMSRIEGHSISGSG